MENNQNFNQGNSFGQNNIYPPQPPFYPPQQPLPNSTAVLVLGILSIVFCWCYGIVGLILGIIALSLSGKAIQLYKENPNYYSISSYNNLKGGRICAIIGTILSGLYLIFIIIYLIVLGVTISTVPWENLAQ